MKKIYNYEKNIEQSIIITPKRKKNQSTKKFPKGTYINKK